MATFKSYISSGTYSRKIDKLPNIGVNACFNITGKKVWLCLLMFRPIAFKQLKSLTTIQYSQFTRGPEVMHTTAVRGFLGSIPGTGKYFYV